MSNAFYSILTLMAIVLAVGCKSKPEEIIQVQTDYDEEWNVPTINSRYYDNKYFYSGRIGYHDIGFSPDTLTIIPIPGLVHKEKFAYCPKDTCFTEYTMMALRCPPVPKLLEWVSKKACSYANDGPVGRNKYVRSDGPKKEIPYKYLSSAEEICDYYMDTLDSIYVDWTCNVKWDRFLNNDQEGHILADCWREGNLFTFYEIYWTDQGNISHESYWTVDAITGKELELSDFVKPKNYDRLSELMMPRLENERGVRLLDQDVYSYTADDKDVLPRLSGCALIREGLIIYFYPYNLACGADGEYYAIIPYSEISRLRPSGFARNDRGVSARNDNY